MAGALKNGYTEIIIIIYHSTLLYFTIVANGKYIEDHIYKGYRIAIMFFLDHLKYIVGIQCLLVG